MEGTDGVQPADWLFWNRPEVGSEVTANEVDTDVYLEGSSSYHIGVLPDGVGEAYASLYKIHPRGNYNEYCLRASTMSPSGNHGLAIYFMGDATNWSEWTSSATDGEWRTVAICHKGTDGDGLDEVRFLLRAKGTQASEIEAWFDEVQVFAR
jgi:hypothetical protein